MKITVGAGTGPATEAAYAAARVPVDDRGYYTMGEAVKAARVTAATLRRALRDAAIPHELSGRVICIPKDALHAWAPRPVHLMPHERAAEVTEAADLYEELGHIHDVAARMRRSPNTIAAYLDEAGVARTMGPASTHPTPAPRECAQADCDVVFVPDAWRAARGEGIYCSEKCRRADFVGRFSLRPVYDEPEPRGCRYCSETFTPSRANAARGNGAFCSRRCSALDRWRRPDGGGLTTLVRHGPLFRGATRQWYLGRWEGWLAAQRARATGRIGRPPVQVDAGALAEILRLHEHGWGRRAIAARLRDRGVTEAAVRRALTEAAVRRALADT